MVTDLFAALEVANRDAAALLQLPERTAEQCRHLDEAMDLILDLERRIAETRATSVAEMAMKLGLAMQQAREDQGEVLDHHWTLVESARVDAAALAFVAAATAGITSATQNAAAAP